MRNLCLDGVFAELAEAGVRNPVVVSGGKHLQVRWTAPGGQARMLVVPATRATGARPRNTRHDVRKILRGDGMLATPEPRSVPVKQPSRIELLERRLGILNGR